MERQLVYCTSTPPRTWPATNPIEAVAPYKPRARVRRGPSVKRVVMSDNDAGATIAAPIPWRARAATRSTASSVNPAASEAPANTSNPTMNTDLRPQVSAMRPPKIKRPPKVMAYAVTTHCTESPPKPSAWRIEGSATLTMLKSKTTMNDATRTKVSADFDSPVARSSLATATGADAGGGVDVGEGAPFNPAISSVAALECPGLGFWLVCTEVTGVSLITVRHVSYT
jgi:hypothetical protein